MSARHVVLHVGRRPPISFRVSVRTGFLIAIACGLVGLAATWTLTLGDFPLSVGEVVDAIAGGASGPADFIVRTLRMPRVLVGIGVGFALAASGAIFQGLVRNPLVSPDVIGVNAGASLAAVFFIVTRGPAALLPVAAFAGALVAALSVYVLAWRRGITGGRLVFVGIGINADRKSVV